MDREVKITFSTSADTSGARKVQSEIDEISAKAKALGVDLSNIGDLNIEGDPSEVIGKIQDALKSKAGDLTNGVEVPINFEADLDALGRLNKQLESLRDRIDVKVEVEDSQLDETARKLSEIDDVADEVSNRRVNVKADSKEIDSTAGKVAALTGAAIALKAVVDSSEVDETAKKVERLDDQSVTVDVETEDTQLESTSEKLKELEERAEGIRHKEVKVRADAREVDSTAGKVAALTGAAIAIKAVVDSTEVDQAAKKVDELELKSVAIDIDTQDAQLETTAERLREVEQRTDGLDNRKVSVRAEGKEVDQVSGKVKALAAAAGAVAVKTIVDDSGIDEARKKLQKVEEEKLEVEARLDTSKAEADFNSLSAKFDALKKKASDLQLRIKGDPKALKEVEGDIEKVASELKQVGAGGLQKLKQSAGQSEQALEQVEQQAKETNATIEKGPKPGRIAKFRASLQNFGNSLQEAEGKGSGFQRFLGKLLARLSGVSNAAIVAAASLGTYLALLKTGFGKLRGAQETTNALELAGASAQEAAQQFADAKALFASSPLSVPGIIDTRLDLIALSEGLIGTKDDLRAFAEIAANITGPGGNVEESFSRIANISGRLFNEVRNGTRNVTAFTEELQQAGAITGKTRERLEEMTDAGATSAEVWQVLREDFERAEGSIAKRGSTLNANVGKISKQIGILKAQIGTAIAKPFLTPLTKLAQVASSSLGFLNKVTKGLLRTLGFTGPALREVGQEGRVAYDEIAKAAERAGEEASKAANRQVKDNERVKKSLEDLLGVVDRSIQSQIALAEVRAERQISEVEARVGVDLTEEEALTRKAEIESKKRLEIFQLEEKERNKKLQVIEREGGDLRSRREEVAGIRSSLEERQSDLRANLERRQKLQDDLLKIRRSEAEVEQRLKILAEDLDKFDRADRRNLEGSSFAPGRKETEEEFAKFTELAERIQASIKEAKDEQDELRAALSDDELKVELEKVTRSTARFRAKEDSVSDALEDYERTLRDRVETIRREGLVERRLFEERDRAAQSREQARLNRGVLDNRRKGLESQQGNADQLSDRGGSLTSTIKDVDKEIADLINQIADTAEIEPDVVAKFKDLARAFEEGADSNDLKDVERIIKDASNQNHETQALAKEIDQLKENRGSLSRELQGTLRGLQESLLSLDRGRANLNKSSPADLENIQNRISKETRTRAISSGEALTKGLESRGEDRLAGEVREATNALRDGATIGELRELIKVAQSVNSEQDPLLQALVSQTATNGNRIIGLLNQALTVQNKMNDRLNRLESQFRNGRR